ncbi:amidase family protein [Streptomyces sp. NPDC088124]|uniref:amidase family protein n=1 Tax=Streptomyces sp. NPDC088124 TaxID=3154654 RepID=UPI00343E21EB
MRQQATGADHDLGRGGRAHPAHTVPPGGSSSGSAAAVAEGVVPPALGSQTAGSLTRPAAYRGVAGFVAPVDGPLSTEGFAGLSHSLDAVGLITPAVADLRLVYGMPTAEVAPPVVAHSLRIPAWRCGPGPNSTTSHRTCWRRWPAPPSTSPWISVPSSSRSTGRYGHPRSPKPTSRSWPTRRHALWPRREPARIC